jgi:2-polyprenyl-3-methyl-5-hydroxy-6-metoxy-1,4-benzoquinol methylase
MTGLNFYESEQAVQQYMEMHYGETEYFGLKNCCITLTQKAFSLCEKFKVAGRALDIGCAVGRTTFELANRFTEVVGIDLSHALIKAANERLESNFSNLKDKVKFIVGDVHQNLNPNLGKFDLILASNIIDRLENPKKFL